MTGLWRLKFLVIIAFVCFASKSATAQITYVLSNEGSPLTFSIADATDESFNGDYSLSASFTSDGTLGRVSRLESVAYSLSGPNDFSVQGDSSSPGGGGILSSVDVFATPETLELSSPGDNLEILDFFISLFELSGGEDLTPSLKFSYFGFTFDSEPIFQTTIPFARQGVSGSAFAFLDPNVEGSSQTTPVLPQGNRTIPFCDCVIWDFEDVPNNAWVDPPLVDSFTYIMDADTDTLFTDIVDFPEGFEDSFEVVVNEESLGVYGPGDSVDFVDVLGFGVSEFTINGINPLVDAEDPLAFPIKLSYSDSTASFSMRANLITQVPEPTALLMIVIGLPFLRRPRV